MIDTLEHIQQLEQGLEFGTIEISLTRHNSQTVGLEGHRTLSRKVADSPAALAAIIVALKQAEAIQMTGKFSCEIEIKDGVACRIRLQELHRASA